jgi:YVTN family beta-propeller protein
MPSKLKLWLQSGPMLSWGSAALLAACASAGGRPPAESTKLEGVIVVANMNDTTATVIDAATRTTVATIRTGVGPHEVAVSRGGRWAVVSNYGVRGAPGNSLTVIDLSVNPPTVSRTIDLGQYQNPHGSAFLPGDSLVLITAQTKQAVLVVNVVRGTVDAAIPTQHPLGHMVALTADGRRAYTGNIGDGTVSELDVPGRSFIRAFPGAPRDEGIGVSPSGDQVWVGSNTAKTVSIIPTASATVTDTLGKFGLPYRIAFTPDGQTAIITDPSRGAVRFVNVQTRAERGRLVIPAVGIVATAEFQGSPCPEGLVVSPDGQTVYIAMQGTNSVAAVDIKSRSIIATMPVGVWPDGVGYSPTNLIPKR